MEAAPQDADENLQSALVAYDDWLAGGGPPVDRADLLTPEVAFRLEQAQAALQLLAKAREHIPHIGVDGAQYDTAPTETHVADLQATPERNLLGMEREAAAAENLPAAMSDAPQRRIARFEIEREIGRGGHGVVFLAYDPQLRRRVALKAPRLDALWRDDLRRRLLQEARAAASLDHPNLVSVHEVGEDGPVCFIASAYCEGPSLRQWLREQPRRIAPRAVAELVAALADGVEHAHRRGVLHRDIKPSNVLLFPKSSAAHIHGDGMNGNPLAEREGYGTPQVHRRAADAAPQEVSVGNALCGVPPTAARHCSAPHGTARSPFPTETTNDLNGQESWMSVSLGAFIPKLTDFGLAKFTGQDGETRTGDRLGSLPYMAPEQADGRLREIGPATDVYALGIVLYELLTGKLPYLGANDADTLRLVLAAEPLPPHSFCPDVPSDLEAVCLKCLESLVARRYASAAELAVDLRRYLAGEPTRARPWGAMKRLRRAARKHPTLAVLAAALALISAGGWWSAARVTGALTVARQEQHKSNRMSYAQSVRLGWHAWQHRQPEQARQWLEAARPRPGQEDLREFAFWHLWKLTHQEKLTLTGADDELLCVAFSPDGRRIAAAGKDRAARVWDGQTGELLHTLLRHTDDVNGVAFHGDGQTLATAGQDGRLCLWETSTGKLVCEVVEAGDLPLLSLAFSPDGTLLAVSDDAGRVRLWDTRILSSRLEMATVGVSVAVGQLVELPPLVGHSDRIGSVVFSADSKLLASGSEDRMIIIWDVASRTEQSRLENLESTVSGVSFSADNAWLASACKQGRRVQRTGIAPPGHTLTIYRHEAWIQSVQFCAGNFVAIGCKDGTLELVDRVDTERRRRLDSHNERIWGLSATRDGQRLASASADRTVKVWQVNDPGALWVQPCTNEIRKMAFSADGKQLIVGATGNTFSVLDAATSAVKLEVGIDYDIHGDFDGDGREDEGVFRDGQWRIQLADASVTEIRRSFGEPGDMPVVGDWNADGRDELALYNSGVWKFDLDNQGERADLAVTSQQIARKLPGIAGEFVKAVETRWESPDLYRGVRRASFLAVAPEATLAATAREGDRQIKFWDLVSGNRLAVLKGDAVALAADFSPDGTCLAIGDAAGNTVLWDVATRSRRQNFSRQGAGVTAVRFAPDGRLLATASQEAVTLWEIATGKVVATMGTSKPHEEWNELAFSLDGGQLAGAFSGGKAVVWDVATAQQRLNLSVGKEVQSVAFSADGQTLATAARAPAGVQLWDLRTGQELVALETPFAPALSVAFSPVGGQLAGAGAIDASRGYIYVWGISPPEQASGGPNAAIATSLMRLR